MIEEILSRVHSEHEIMEIGTIEIPSPLNRSRVLECTLSVGQGQILADGHSITEERLRMSIDSVVLE